MSTSRRKPARRPPPKKARRRARPAKGKRPPARRRAKSRRRDSRSRGRARLLLLGVAVIGGIVFAVSRIDLGETIKEVTLPLRHDDIIRQQADRFDLDPALVAAVINQESGFVDQTSSAGARGLMQITPDTADTIEILSGGETFTDEDLANPDLNIRYGTFYLDHLLDRFAGNEIAALAAYNGGPENAAAWGGAELVIGDIQFAETRAYVKSVLEKRRLYAENYGDELGLD